MTNHDYKAIADRLVERRIVSRLAGKYWMPLGGEIGELPLTVCHDWRVAGACMERAVFVQSLKHPDGPWLVDIGCDPDNDKKSGQGENKSLPLAIILAYLESESENKRGDSENGPGN